MKKLLTVLFLALFSVGFSQTYTSTILKDTSRYDRPIYMERAGSCGSPDGAMNSTTTSPPNYAWLQTNGYCNPAAYGTNPTVCWTFTPTSSSVTINSGYSQSGCANVSFGSLNLYGPGCVFISGGLNFTGLTPGLQYTWCMSGSAWGGGPGCTGFTDFCPYFFNNTVLPIELITFIGVRTNKYNILTWTTLSELNNDYYTIERSVNGMDWVDLGIVYGAGNSSSINDYIYYDRTPIDGVSYYKLKQTDFDGMFTYSETISVVRPVKQLELIKIVNMMGQEVDEEYIGLKIYQYSDGTVKKVYQ